jgi:biotin transport system permease protein
MVTLFRPGNSLLHRLPAGPKLLVLMILIAVISIVGSNPMGALAALLATAMLYSFAFAFAFAANAGSALFLKQIWSLKWLLLLIVVPQLIFGASWQIVWANAVRLTAAILLATLFTFTTKNSELMLAIERTFKPLERIGIKPETASLTLAMTINAIPMITKFLAQTKEAQQARGIKPTATLITVPLLVASLKYADEFAEALTARGVEI